MAGMQDVEAAVGEADARPLAAPFGQPLFEHRPIEDDLLLGRERQRREVGGGAAPTAETVAVPRLPTTTAAAALAARIAGSKSQPAPSIAAITATTVSPAPDTSRTLTG